MKRLTYQVEYKGYETGQSEITCFENIVELQNFFYQKVDHGQKGFCIFRILECSSVRIELDGELSEALSDRCLIYSYFYQRGFGDFPEHKRDSGKFTKLKGYVEQVIADAYATHQEPFIEGVTVDYAIHIINGKVYLHVQCANDNVRSRLFYRLVRNIERWHSVRLKDSNDLFVLGTQDKSKFPMRVIMSEFNQKSFFLNLNERRLRSLMEEDGISLRSDPFDYVGGEGVHGESKSNVD